MAVFQITLTSGTLLAAVPENSTNTSAASISLFGRGVTEYGEGIQNNIVHILENFAGGSQPSNPIVGQLWFDTSQGSLKVFDGSVFTPVNQPDNGSITDVKVAANAAIALNKLAPGTTPGQIIVVDAALVPGYTAMAGEAEIDSDGNILLRKTLTLGVSGAVTGTAPQTDFGDVTIPTTLADAIVGENNLQAGAVTETKLGPLSVNTAKIQDQAVTEDKLGDSSVSTIKLQASSVTTAKLADAAVTGEKIALATITASNLASGFLGNGVVTASTLANNSVTTSAIAALAVTVDKMAANSVGGAALQSDSVDSDKILSGAVDNSAIFQGAVTIDKIENGISASANEIFIFNGSSIEFGQLSASLIPDFGITAIKIFQPYVTADYGGLVAPVFSNEINSQDLATTQNMLVDYGDLS